MASDVQVEEHGPEVPICLVVKRLELLDAMEGRARDVYRRDMEANLRAMRRVEGGYGNVEAWDVPFYTNMIKVQWQHRRWREEWDDADAAGADYGDDHDNASQFPGYFTVENSIWGKKISLDNDER